MKPQSSRFDPNEVDRLIAKFGEKPAENTRQTLERELLKQKERFIRSQTPPTRHHTRDDSHER
ncbi:MAG TPA: hypothetical protein VNQ90_10370 [Chthoniobacteraceae bacterium]|nr:hypothetical protein [Chthoniobacteraceae bacterium]